MEEIRSDPLRHEALTTLIGATFFAQFLLVSAIARYQVKQVNKLFCLFSTFKRDKPDLASLGVMQLDDYVVWQVLSWQELHVFRLFYVILILVVWLLGDKVSHVQSLKRCSQIIKHLLTWILHLCEDVESTVGEDNVTRLPEILLVTLL